jgi:hypothetical protein
MGQESGYLIPSRYKTRPPILTATFPNPISWKGLNLDRSPGTLDEFVYFGPGVRLTYTRMTVGNKIACSIPKVLFPHW